MLNIGLIGDIKLLEPHIKKAQAHPGVHITGKSSVGTQPKPGSFKLNAPEFNRIELIERSDALFINRFSLLPFGLLCDMVKKSKHFFAVGYPDLKPAEFNQLAKLAHEAKTVIQIKNSFYFLPAVQWLVKHIKNPAFIDIQYYSAEVPNKNSLLELLLMMKDTAGNLPKKTGAISFCSTPADASNYNVQLDYGNGIVINLNFGKTTKAKQFGIKLFMQNFFANFDLINNKNTVNNLPINPSELEAADETNAFINSILEKKKATTDIETYSTALQTLAMIQEKLDRYTSV